jgi:hypothetical protein
VAQGEGPEFKPQHGTKNTDSKPHQDTDD